MNANLTMAATLLEKMASRYLPKEMWLMMLTMIERHSWLG